MCSTVALPDADSTRALGEQIAALLRAGDLVILTGALGAGKTTLAQGIGRGLAVRGQVTSPTFVIARVHQADGGGPGLVHVDAYRLGSVAELDALDLEATMEEAVTVVEWGEGLAETLTPNRLEVVLERGRGMVGVYGGGDRHGDDSGDQDPGPRRAVLRGIGPRWLGVGLPGDRSVA